MTLEELRKVSDLLVTMDDAKDWGETFDEARQPFILFKDVVGANNVLGDGLQHGWEGPLRLPRSLAIEMMMWLQLTVKERLVEFGVEFSLKSIKKDARPGQSPPTTI